MPIVNGAYDAPTWNNNAPPAIDASELQDMCDTIETYNTQKADVDYVNTFVRPNILDNWYFVGGGSQQGGGKFPINQRGSASYATGTQVYCIDRWKADTGQPAAFSVSLASDGLSLVRSGSATYPSFQQVVENASRFAGQKVTISALIKQTGAMPGNISLKNSADGSGSAFLQTPISGSYSDWTLISATGTVPSDTTNLRFFIYVGTSGSYSYTLKVAAVKIELGSTQTLAHQENGVWVLNEIPNYQQELAKCQRFFYMLNPGNTGFAYIDTVACDSGASLYPRVNFPVPMRTSPTVSYTGSWTVNCDSTRLDVSSIALDRFYYDFATLKVSSSSMVTGEAYSFRSKSSGGTISFSADL